MPVNGPIHVNEKAPTAQTKRPYSVPFNGTFPRDPNACIINGPIHSNRTAPVHLMYDPTITQQSFPSPANKLIERYNGVWSFSWSRKPTLSSVKLTSSPKQKAVGSMITKPEQHEKMANPTGHDPNGLRGERRAARQGGHIGINVGTRRKHTNKVANPTDIYI